jgi:hypothetical protein
MHHRVWLAAFAASPFMLVAEGSAQAAGAHWSEGLVTAQGEPLVLMENCASIGSLPGESRCFSSRLVTEGYAAQRLLKVQEHTARRRHNPFDANCMSSGGGTPVMTPPVGLLPSDLQAAYGLNAAGMPSGAGSVVAIVDACADRSVVADLKMYRDHFNLGALPECGGKDGVLPTKGGPPCIGVVSQSGTAALPPQDDGWAGEIALDVDMVSAACPSCSILLVEANSATNSDLGAAVNFAASHADSISNSYGSTESGSDSATDYKHDGVLVVAASGDSDYYNQIQITKASPTDPSTWFISYSPQGASVPASMPTVLAVGGTTIVKSSSSPTGYTDEVWNKLITGTKYPNLTGKYIYGTGSGCSTEFPRPDFQSVLSGKTGSCSMRASVDVSAAADYQAPPGADGGATSGGGILVYQGTAGWEQVVGTSAASPFVAALLTRIGYASKPISAIYGKASTFHDVTTGNNDPSKFCSDVNCNAGPGWDGPSGWGTPNAAAILGLDGGAVMPDAGGGTNDAGGGTNDDGGTNDAGGGGGMDASVHDAGGVYDEGGSADASSHDAGGTHPRDAGGGVTIDAGDDQDDGGPSNGDTGGTSSGCRMTPGANPVAPAGFALLAVAGVASVVARRRRR